MHSFMYPSMYPSLYPCLHEPRETCFHASSHPPIDTVANVSIYIPSYVRSNIYHTISNLLTYSSTYLDAQIDTNNSSRQSALWMASKFRWTSINTKLYCCKLEAAGNLCWTVPTHRGHVACENPLISSIHPQCRKFYCAVLLCDKFEGKKLRTPPAMALLPKKRPIPFIERDTAFVLELLLYALLRVPSLVFHMVGYGRTSSQLWV